MLASKDLRQPLLLRLAYTTRTPAVISGFVGSDDFGVVEGFLPHCTVHRSLVPAGSGASVEEGVEMWRLVLESELDDVFDGEKNVLLLRQAVLPELEALAAGAPRGWVATSIEPAKVLAGRLGVPVFDLKTLEWLNAGDEASNTTWERAALASRAGGELRRYLAGRFSTALALAKDLASGEGAGAIAGARPCDLAHLATLVSSYFGLDEGAVACLLGDGASAGHVPVAFKRDPRCLPAAPPAGAPVKSRLAWCESAASGLESFLDEALCRAVTLENLPGYVPAGPVPRAPRSSREVARALEWARATFDAINAFSWLAWPVACGGAAPARDDGTAIDRHGGTATWA